MKERYVKDEVMFSLHLFVILCFIFNECQFVSATIGEGVDRCANMRLFARALLPTELLCFLCCVLAVGNLINLTISKQ